MYIHGGVGRLFCYATARGWWGVGACLSRTVHHRLCRMAVKECGSSPVAFAVMGQHVPVTRRLRALAHHSTVAQQKARKPRHQACNKSTQRIIWHRARTN